MILQKYLVEQKMKGSVALEQPYQEQEQKNQGNDYPSPYPKCDDLHHESNYRDGDNDHNEDHEQSKDADRGSYESHERLSANDNMRSTESDNFPSITKIT